MRMMNLTFKQFKHNTSRPTVDVLNRNKEILNQNDQIETQLRRTSTTTTQKQQQQQTPIEQSTISTTTPTIVVNNSQNAKQQ